MPGIPPLEDGIFASVTRLFRTMRDVAENRVELFLIECKEERARLFGAILLAAAGTAFAFMALLLLTFLVVAVFWETHRLLTLVLLAVAYAVAALAVFFMLRSRLQRWCAFSATLEQIKKDRSCFEKPN